MALNYRDTYPAGTEDNGDYPFGKAKNVSAPGAGDGFPFDKGFVNDVIGFFAALLDGQGITPSGVPDTAANSDYYDALLAAGTAAAQDPENVAAAITATSEKTTFADSDKVPLLDSAAAYGLKFIQWLNFRINIGRVAFLPTGIVVSNNGSDATNDLDFATGYQRDSTNVYNLVATASRTKRMDANWTAGNNGGLKASGAAAWGAGTWHIFMIGKSSDPAAFDYIADTSLTCTNGLADVSGSGFDIFKRILSLRTSGAAWVAFSMRIVSVGMIRVLLKVPTFEFQKDWAGVDDTAQTGTLTMVPSDIQVNAMLAVYFRDNTIAASSTLLVSSLDQTDTAPNINLNAFIGTYQIVNDGSAVDRFASGPVEVRTSTSRTFRYRATGSTVDHAVSFCIQGWEDAIL